MLFQRPEQLPSELEPCPHREELVELIPWQEQLERHELEPQRHKLEPLRSSCSSPLASTSQRDSGRTSFLDGSKLELEHKPALERRLVPELAGKLALAHKLLAHRPGRLVHSLRLRLVHSCSLQVHNRCHKDRLAHSEACEPSRTQAR